MPIIAPTRNGFLKPLAGGVGRLDTSNPLTVGLRIACPMTEGLGGVHDFVTGQVAAKTSGSIWRANGPNGPAATVCGGDEFAFPYFAYFDPSGPGFTVSCLLYDNSNNNAVAFAEYDHGVNGWAIYNGGAGWGLYTDAWGLTNGSAASPAGLWRRVTGTWDKATVRVYYDGIQVASSAQTTAIPTGGPVSIGDSGRGAVVVGDAFLWTRCLSATEVRALAAEPYAMFRPSRLWAVNSIAAAGGLPFFMQEVLHGGLHEMSGGMI